MSHPHIETPQTFTLIAPIQVGDDALTEITLREPTVGDVEQLNRDQEKDGSVVALIKLISKQSKVAPVDVRKLGARDFNIMQEYLGAFLGEPAKHSES